MIKTRFFNQPYILYQREVPYVQADENGMLQGKVFFCHLVSFGTVLGFDICVVDKLGEWHDGELL
jgi:hypothetical protein